MSINIRYLSQYPYVMREGRNRHFSAVVWGACKKIGNLFAQSGVGLSITAQSRSFGKLLKVTYENLYNDHCSMWTFDAGGLWRFRHRTREHRCGDRRRSSRRNIGQCCDRRFGWRCSGRSVRFPERLPTKLNIQNGSALSFGRGTGLFQDNTGFAQMAQGRCFAFGGT